MLWGVDIKSGRALWGVDIKNGRVLWGVDIKSGICGVLTIIVVGC